MAWALITGGSRGIGRACALRLAADGFDVLLSYREREDAAVQVAEEIRNLGQSAEIFALDTSEGQAAEQIIEDLIKTHGCPHALVNNAGMTHDVLFPMMARESWEKVIQTNLGGFYSVTRPVVRQMIRRRAGRVVSLASISGQRGNPGQVSYSASKGGIIAATKALALELAPRGITVNAVAPGFITTEMVEHLPQEQITALIPMKRPGTPEEVATAVAFLCSDDASYITGAVLSVNGGLYT